VGCNAKTLPIGSSKFLPHPMGYPTGGLESETPTHGAPLSGLCNMLVHLKVFRFFIPLASEPIWKKLHTIFTSAEDVDGLATIESPILEQPCHLCRTLPLNELFEAAAKINPTYLLRLSGLNPNIINASGATSCSLLCLVLDLCRSRTVFTLGTTYPTCSPHHFNLCIDFGLFAPQLSRSIRNILTDRFLNRQPSRDANGTVDCPPRSNRSRHFDMSSLGSKIANRMSIAREIILKHRYRPGYWI
jgi:hypothetical protein